MVFATGDSRRGTAGGVALAVGSSHSGSSDALRLTGVIPRGTGDGGAVEITCGTPGGKGKFILLQLQAGMVVPSLVLVVPP